jgi:hypothetical protein
MTELLVAIGLIAGVVATHEIGFWVGSLTRSKDEPFDRQVGLVRTSTAAQDIYPSRSWRCFLGRRQSALA